MKYNLKKSHTGFTLIEVIVVVAIMGLILSFGLVTSFDSYRGYNFRSERGTLVSVLQRARSRAMTNFNQAPHGVCYDDIAKSYIAFQGVSFATAVNPESTGASPAVAITAIPATFVCSSNQGVVFSQITGNTTAIDITITQNDRSSIISINNEGTINW